MTARTYLTEIAGAQREAACTGRATAVRTHLLAPARVGDRVRRAVAVSFLALGARLVTTER